MNEHVKQIETILAQLKASDETPSVNDVVAALAAVSKQALDGLQAVRRERLLLQPAFVEEDGFEPLAADIWIDAAYCDVLVRKEEGGSRSYLVIGQFGGDGRRVIGASDRAPDSEAIGDFLLNAGLLQEKPMPGHEWAINIDCENPCESNFPAQELRDCAFDDLILDGSVSADSNQVVCFFEIEANGEQDDDLKFYVEPAEWVQERGIAFPSSIQSRGEADRSNA